MLSSLPVWLQYTLIVFGSVVLLLIIMKKVIIDNITNSYFTHKDPTHLIVVQHGWMAPWIRATPLAKSLAAAAKTKHSLNPDNRCLIHVIRANSDDYVFGWWKTQDGIHRGGQRTTNEIESVLDKHKSINRISLIGQSLGGLYIRYAIKQLYDPKTGKLRGTDPINFVTLSSPHLGADDRAKHQNPKLYLMARYLVEFGFLPSTLTQLLRLDHLESDDPESDDQIRFLHQMASEEEYLEPLRAFKNRLIYGNVINDHRVSCSSGLMLPSFDYHDEKAMIQEMYREQIEKSQREKRSFVEPLLNERAESSSRTLQDVLKYLKQKKEGDMVLQGMRKEGITEKADNEWFGDLSGSMEWQRFAVTMNTGFLDRQWAHELLANPYPQISSCQPILEHLEKRFQW